MLFDLPRGMDHIFVWKIFWSTRLIFPGKSIGNIQKINPVFLQRFGMTDTVCKSGFKGSQPDSHNKLLRHCLFDLFQNLHCKPLRILSIFIGPFVDPGIEKFTHQITVAPVQFHPVIAGLISSHRSFHKLILHLLYLFFRHFMTDSFFSVFIHLIITRTKQVLTGAVHPCMMDLQKYRAVFFMHRIYDLFQPIDLSILPDAQLIFGKFPFRIHTGSLLNDQAGTAPGNGSVMINISLNYIAVFLHPVIAHHRRHTDTVLYF